MLKSQTAESSRPPIVLGKRIADRRSSSSWLVSC
ncbi:hypothetical protein CGMCC3_g1572 [Colletotrichum fructicola]|nr:uncharacterized protein CGMCC3_g1572 [Colletotrichum fructicola]KAE9582323.1 hypothetical protein CGMCC3_g1572 [Colletotrichum fructicola]